MASLLESEHTADKRPVLDNLQLRQRRRKSSETRLSTNLPICPRRGKAQAKRTCSVARFVGVPVLDAVNDMALHPNIGLEKPFKQRPQRTGNSIRRTGALPVDD